MSSANLGTKNAPQTDKATQRKWDNAAKAFDFMTGIGPDKRWGPYKSLMLANMNADADILFLALGTGLDIQFFPPQRNIQAIDISPKMLENAQARIDQYDGSINAQTMDVHQMSFEAEQFDQVFTSCTFCSVPNPIGGLKALYQVMKPGADLYMFEHTGSKHYPFKLMMDLMTPLTRKVGPDMNRTTIDNVQQAGFKIQQINNVYLDIVKIIHATKPE
ncbi:MAG: SAM-dependent methyltransferase [Moraxellaceae bacterium]|nr:MAG: SAM-dependent methyltransferase [Moraxellaceae bacterium]